MALFCHERAGLEPRRNNCVNRREGRSPKKSPAFFEPTWASELGGFSGFQKSGVCSDRRQRCHRWYIDPAASILIGLLLAAATVLLARESGALLLGERTNRARIKRVKEIIKKDAAVEQVGDLLTMPLGPDQVLLNVDIRFRGN